MSEGVSCLCLTYGRPHLLEEAIESFLRQTWEGAKELLVLNDHPDQRLVCDHPEVVVINLPKRIRTLGEKRNLSVALATYDNLLVWDDDDIYLPWRIEETMKTLTTAQFFKCPQAWIMNDGKLELKPGYNLFHGGTAYTRWLFEKSGGYSMMNGGEDADIENKFQNITEKKGEYWPHTNLPEERLYYIYRWSHGSYHTTGVSNIKQIKPEIQKGEVVLEPKWNLPYQDLAYQASHKTNPAPTVKKHSSSINFVCFSKNRPLQLDGYIRSFEWAFESEIQDLSVLYTCDPSYQNAYDLIVKKYPWVNFLKQDKFHNNLTSLLNDAPYTCFGCDDVVFTNTVDVKVLLDEMAKDQTFAFSLRLGKNIVKSMFSGKTTHPKYEENNGVISWNLHDSHPNGDFGYSWELDGTIYPSDVVCQIVSELRADSPNILEVGGGGKWSSKTKKSHMASFNQSSLSVVTVNVVQNNFPNPVLGQEVSPQFLLNAWNCGLRLDVERYRDKTFDCVHIPDLYLTNR